MYKRGSAHANLAVLLNSATKTRHDRVRPGRDFRLPSRAGGAICHTTYCIIITLNCYDMFRYILIKFIIVVIKINQ